MSSEKVLLVSSIKRTEVRIKPKVMFEAINIRGKLFEITGAHVITYMLSCCLLK
jgi:hypothetical protein